MGIIRLAKWPKNRDVSKIRKKNQQLIKSVNKTF